MAQNTTLLFKADPNRLDALVIDGVITSGSRAEDTEITQHPVEDGADVADHVRLKPRALKLEITLTDTPIPSGTGNGQGTTVEAAPGRAQQLYDRLARLKDQRTLLNLFVRGRSYQNMLISSLTDPFDSRTGDAVICTAQLVEIRIVQTQLVAIKRTATPRAKGKQDLNKKTGQPADDKTKDHSSVAIRLGKSFGWIK